jgi:hypothetical protein
MKIADQIVPRDPRTITIPPHRQRSIDDLDEEFIASIQETNGPFNPIIVKSKDDQVQLVAGKRRLEASLKLNLDSIKTINLESLDPIDAELIELEENAKRRDLPWRDLVSARARIHKLYLDRDPTWTVSKTAKSLNIGEPLVYDTLNVYANLNSPRLLSAANFSQALGILSRFSERKTAAVVQQIAAAGASIFNQTPTNQLPPHLQPLSTPNKTKDLNLDNLNLDLDDEEASNSQPPTSNQATEGLASAVPSLALPTINSLFPSPTTPPAPQPQPSSSSFLTQPPILQANFLQWAESYSGPPFNFIHCDFPYGVNTEDSVADSYENTKEIFWALTDCLCLHLPKLLSHSAHLMFWLSLRRDLFDQTKAKLAKSGVWVIDRPLIWFKSDMKGAAPGIRGTQPRHTYEAALLCYKGNRPLVKQGGDGYSAPNVSSNLIHPTQKPESMLSYFFSMLIDETTDMLDPTAGSGASIRVAETLGAKSVLGLEIDENYCAAANNATIRARTLRAAGRTFNPN